MRGGYQIIDCAGVYFTAGTATKVSGAYALIEGTRKPIRLNNVVVGGTEYHDAFCEFTVSESNFTGTTYGYTVTVTQDDAVTFTTIE